MKWRTLHFQSVIQQVNRAVSLLTCEIFLESHRLEIPLKCTVCRRTSEYVATSYHVINT